MYTQLSILLIVVEIKVEIIFLFDHDSKIKLFEIRHGYLSTVVTLRFSR